MSNQDDIKHILQRGLDGVYGRAEFLTRLFEALTPENLQQFLILVPHSVIADLQAWTLELPTSEGDWSRLAYVQDYCDRSNHESQLDARSAEDEARRRRFRTGVETLCWHIENSGR